MDQRSQRSYLEPTEQAGRAFFSRTDNGPLLMLNLMRFRDVADYVDRPDLMPDIPISGQAAFQLYMDQTLPLLKKTGGDLLLYGTPVCCRYFQLQVTADEVTRTCLAGADAQQIVAANI